jgi:hypothetical protein
VQATQLERSWFPHTNLADEKSEHNFHSWGLQLQILDRDLDDATAVGSKPPNENQAWNDESAAELNLTGKPTMIRTPDQGR